MSLRDFALLVLVCFLWAANNIVLKYVVSVLDVPPLFFAALRFVLATLFLMPWLFPAPRPVWRLLVVGLLMGAGTFGFMFVGMTTATPSAAAVVLQVGVPVTALLSVVMLGEKLRPRRVVGIALTFAGAMIVVWNPTGLTMSTGLILVALSTVTASVASVMMKQMEGVRPLQYQAWVGFVSVVPLIALSAGLEHGQVQAAIDGGWRLAAAVVGSGLLISVFSHSVFFWLVQRYEASLISTLGLMTTLATIGLGVTIFHDPFGPQMIVGTLVALTGVLVVALRPHQFALILLALRNRGR